ncbi:MAG: hypothetical protein IJT94_17450 [Oscillibacter sp.]|nr:hypothetical protein [Oscillibacter sp.]
MKIVFQPDKTGKISAELLEVSRTLRSVGYEIGDVLRELRSVSELDACRRSLRNQESAVVQETARLVSLSAALDEIAELYGRAEQRNADRLEGSSGLYRSSAGGALARGGSVVRTQMAQFLYR